MVDLKDTIELMTSEDYKERFRAEYYRDYNASINILNKGLSLA